jgi:hypothetical protein
MTKELYGLCQSGQAVEVAGIYEVIGVRPKVRDNGHEKTVYTLHTGEFFPDYEGRAVCWYLIESLAAQGDSQELLTTLCWQVSVATD